MNLSSVYMISILLTSIAGVGSAFLGNKFVPMIPTPDEVSENSTEQPTISQTPPPPQPQTFMVPSSNPPDSVVPQLPGASV